MRYLKNLPTDISGAHESLIKARKSSISGNLRGEYESSFKQHLKSLNEHRKKIEQGVANGRLNWDMMKSAKAAVTSFQRDKEILENLWAFMRSRRNHQRGSRSWGSHRRERQFPLKTQKSRPPRLKPEMKKKKIRTTQTIRDRRQEGMQELRERGGTFEGPTARSVGAVCAWHIYTFVAWHF